MSRSVRDQRRSTPPPPSRRRGVAAAIAAAGVVLAGCAAGQVAQTATQVAAIDGANGTTGTVTVLNARLAAPEEGQAYAVGESARLLLFISNEGLDADTLESVSSPVAEAVEIAGEAVVSGNTLVDYAQEDGEVSIEVVGLTEELYFGQSVPMTFSFANAGDITVNVPVETREERDEAETVEILPPHPVPLWEEGHGGEGEEHGGEEHAEESALSETDQPAATQADGPGGTETPRSRLTTPIPTTPTSDEDDTAAATTT